jgi:hypothetical protein
VAGKTTVDANIPFEEDLPFLGCSIQESPSERVSSVEIIFSRVSSLEKSLAGEVSVLEENPCGRVSSLEQPS